MQHLAPIALFVYNRPEHTRRTIAHLQKNFLAEESRLVIFSDAPSSEKDQESVNQTRELIKVTDGFKSVRIVERPGHQGLANSIIDGVSQLTAQYGKVIVFEDDLLSSPYTLKYLNQALKKYENNTKVMQIAAYMFPLKEINHLPETFFFRATNSWGWATWARAWDKLEVDINKLHTKFDQEKIKKFTVGGTMNFWKQFIDNKDGKNNSWAVRWYASVFLNNGLTLYPRKSLIENIGHDGTGVHSIIENTYQVTTSKIPVEYLPDEVIENTDALKELTSYFKNRKGSLLKRGEKFLRNKWYQFVKRK